MTHLPQETIPLSTCNTRDGDLHRKNPGAFCQRVVNAEGQSSLAVRCKMLVLGTGDGFPIPTVPGATRSLLWEQL